MRPGKNFVGGKLFGDRFGYFVVRINQRIAPELFLDSLDEDARVVKAHVLRRIFTFEIERNQVVSFGLNRLQKEVRLLNRRAGFAKVISAPFIAALLCFDLAFLIQTIDSVADGGAMDDRHHARVGRQLVPVDFISFVGINRQRDVWILPGFGEFGRLGEGRDS